MRQMEWIGTLGQQNILLDPDTVYIAIIIIPALRGCKEGPIKNAISAGGFSRQKLSDGRGSLPGWLQNRPIEGADKRAAIERDYPGWCIWYARIKTSGPGSKSLGPYQFDDRGGLILESARIWAIYEDGNNKQIHDAHRTTQRVPEEVKEESCFDQCVRRTGDRVACEAACRPSGGPPPGYIKTDPGSQTTERVPPGYIQLPAGTTNFNYIRIPGITQEAPTPVTGMQLYVIDPATGAGTPYGDPQPMSHEDVRRNIEAGVSTENPILGYGPAGTGTPDFGVYNSTVTPPAWNTMMIRLWHLDEASRGWKRGLGWGLGEDQPLPVEPFTARQMIADAVNNGLVGPVGWSPPNGGEPVEVYRDGDWHVPGMFQLWVVYEGGWAHYGSPALRTEIGVRADIEAAMAQGSPPLAYSTADSVEPTWTFENGQWTKIAPELIEEFSLPDIPFIPDLPGGTNPLPFGVQPQYPWLLFPTPAMPGVPAAVATRAVEAIGRAAAACPQLASADGPLQHALAAFGVFGALSKVQGLPVDTNLNVLHTELDKMCPQWKGKKPGDPPADPRPELPTSQPDVSELLAQVALALTTAATSALPDLYNQAKSLDMPGLAEQIRQYAEASGDPIPDATPEKVDGDLPDDPPDMTDVDEKAEKKAKKKGISGLAVAGIVALGIGAAFLLS